MLLIMDPRTDVQATNVYGTDIGSEVIGVVPLGYDCITNPCVPVARPRR